MMAYDLGDDEVQELLGELGVKLGVLRQRPQAGDLLGLARGVGGRQTVRCLQLTDLLGDLEPLGEEMHQGRIHVVDAHPQPQQLLGHRVIHGAQPNQWRRCPGSSCVSLDTTTARYLLGSFNDHWLIPVDDQQLESLARSGMLPCDEPA